MGNGSRKRGVVGEVQADMGGIVVTGNRGIGFVGEGHVENSRPRGAG
jgi:hypothetical protein